MTADIVGEFAKYLAAKESIGGDLISKVNSAGSRKAERKLRDLWELTGLSANDFADEVARFYGLARVSLPQLVAASSLVRRFSRRFLRETAVFPYQAKAGDFRLVVADPSDVSAVRAAEIVLGGPVELEVASFEDIGTILSDRLGEDDAPSGAVGGGRARTRR